MSNTIYLVTSGDLRLSANQVCWPAQNALEQALSAAVGRFGHQHQRAHAFDPAKSHGFIDSQRSGIDVFRTFLGCNGISSWPATRQTARTSCLRTRSTIRRLSFNDKSGCISRDGNRSEHLW
jgi:hypothetical protein